MQVNITFRQMEAEGHIKDYVKQKVNKVKKYVPEPVKASVVLSTEKFRQLCDVTIVTAGQTFKGSESSEDMMSSIDKVMDKIERQLRERKSRT
jgi:putative sigma-54 modulation protein